MSTMAKVRLDISFICYDPSSQKEEPSYVVVLAPRKDFIVKCKKSFMKQSTRHEDLIKAHDTKAICDGLKEQVLITIVAANEVDTEMFRAAI